MAPKKGKIQGKRNNIKIRSKSRTQKRGLNKMKKRKAGEKPLENLKWLNKIAAAGPTKGCTGVPDWLNACVYKQEKGSISSSSSTDYSSERRRYTREDDRSVSSEVSNLSDECNCTFPERMEAKSGILKRKSSSSHSLVAEYIKSGMNHVASFIVESAIRFGEEHGVVFPDKKVPNVYEIMSPVTRPADDKVRRIRFKTTDWTSKTGDYEDAKKAKWKSQIKNTINSLRTKRSAEDGSSWSTRSSADSLDNILPLLEKLKEEGEIVNSELDLNKFRMEDGGDDDDDYEEAEEEEDDEEKRKREKYKEKLRMLRKRYKSVGPESEDGTQEREYSAEKKGPWKKFRRDSIELGRQRLRPPTYPRKDSMSPSPY